ncbi:SMP-30/gluconolactonase/LRE family protein [Streptomyces millisiae]|uniref:SMP-30/gluconolactonase/LRE family protein n=1 Tax=Streptomyces millisiae TaxID=3075542 RepID=A0ABU2LN71_9ACTN|nr:SMP-30/gluconolactonase/LRE family protein [Streptomyces sp. DSM 44918]MDT0318950.1 SMP-30/gluconolactonase/LRE family protein [Streptomyces sp. DSM 44918]
MSSSTDTRSSRFDPTGAWRPHTGEGWRAARLNHPNPLWGSNGVAFGPDGRLYVAQFLAGRISALDPATGDVETVVGPGSPVQAPDDLAFGADGAMYIADLTPGRVWRRDPAGSYTLVSDAVAQPNGITCVGDRLFVNEMRVEGRLVELFPDGRDPVVLADDLAFGNAMQRGPDGRLYYPHMLTGQVWRVHPDGGPPELFADRVDEPVAVRFDRGGALVVLSRGPAGVLTRIDPDGGRRTTLATGVTGLDNAAFDAENRMFVSSYASGGLTEVRPDGRTREVVPRGLNGPFGITVDLGGRVHAADHFSLTSAPLPDPGTPAASQPAWPDEALTRRLIIFAHGVTAEGGLLHVTTRLGEVHTHDPAADTTRVRATGLREPVGIVAAPDGTLLVAEAGAGRVVRIHEGGGLTVLAEGLEHPVDVALDAAGRCLVSDDRTGAVLRLDEDGAATTVADGLGAPQGLVVDGDALYTVETAHRRLTAISLTTGERRVVAERLPVGEPPGARRAEPAGPPGVVAPPPLFAGLALAPDGSLLLSANGEGTVLRLHRSDDCAD